MTNLELMLLEHAVKANYTDSAANVDSEGNVFIRFKANGCLSMVAHLSLKSSAEASNILYEEVEGNELIKKVLIKFKNDTDVTQALDKFASHIKKAKLDMVALRQPYMQMPQPSSRCDDFITGVIKSDPFAPNLMINADSFQFNVLRGAERVIMLKDDATAHSSTPAIQLNDEMKATVEAFKGTVCGAPMPPPPPKEKGE